LGRITFQKGPEYFVEAAKKVIERDPNVRFVMAGSGDLLNRMIDRVAELRMGTKFHFTGFLKGDDVDHMYAISDVYVMPSVSEPFGIAPLEAVRHNTPVIISKQSGVAEVLKNAIKVDFWDVDAMADAIFGLLHYDSISKMFKELGGEELKKLKWEHVAAKLVTVYEKTLAQRS
jgi:glycosyltransferase involved in cell wall biosynthesis